MEVRDGMEEEGGKNMFPKKDVPDDDMDKGKGGGRAIRDSELV